MNWEEREDLKHDVIDTLAFRAVHEGVNAQSIYGCRCSRFTCHNMISSISKFDASKSFTVQNWKMLPVENAAPLNHNGPYADNYRPFCAGCIEDYGQFYFYSNGMITPIAPIKYLATFTLSISIRPESNTVVGAENKARYDLRQLLEKMERETNQDGLVINYFNIGLDSLIIHPE